MAAVALSKANRLRRRQDFQAVYQSGLRRAGRYFTLRALRQKDAVAPTQIGISISLKVSKRAVKRNRIKRQIRGALRQLLPRIAPGWQVVVVVKPALPPECDYARFLQELEQLLAQAEVINGH